jgi:membrane-bound serine protease (ClpP class)
MFRRILVLVALTATLGSLGGDVLAQEEPAVETGSGPVDVLDVGGPLDELVIDFLIEEIERSDAQLVVLQLDSPGAVTGAVAELIDLVADPPVPVAVWIGPRPGQARGGVAQLLAAAPIRAAAPGVELGQLAPTVAGGSDDAAVKARFPEVAEPLLATTTRVTAPIPGLVDVVTPSLGQLIAGLDGARIELAGRTVILDTAEPSAEGTGPQVSVEVRFDKGPLWMRTLRIAVQPGTAYFFLVAGLSLAVFEFYAAGVGVMAAVAVLALLLGGYGVVALPTRWWAVGLVILGLLLYVADFQRNDLGWRSLLGTAALAAGGLWFVDAGGQFGMVWWVVLLVVAGSALFFGVGMTAVVRSRFSTATIGRDYLIGRHGVAASDFDPDGVVEVDGARWQAFGYRAAGISTGDAVSVVGVDGIVLEVEPDVRE